MANQSQHISCPIAHHQSRKHIFSYCHVSLPELNIVLSSRKSLGFGLFAFLSPPFPLESSFSSYSINPRLQKYWQWRPASLATHVGSSSEASLLKDPLHLFLLLLPSLLHPASRLVSFTTNGLSSIKHTHTHTHANVRVQRRICSLVG